MLKMNETEFLRIIFMVVFIVLALRFLLKREDKNHDYNLCIDINHYIWV